MRHSRQTYLAPAKAILKARSHLIHAALVVIAAMMAGPTSGVADTLRVGKAATNKIIAAKPEMLRGFLKGWFETIAFMRGNKSETVRIAKGIMGTDETTTAGIYDELMPMFSSTGKFDAKALAVLSRSFVEMKTLPSEPQMSNLHTEAFLPEN